MFVFFYIGIAGMHGDRSIAKKLLYWLKSWYDNRSSSKKLTKPSKWDWLH